MKHSEEPVTEENEEETARNAVSDQAAVEEILGISAPADTRSNESGVNAGEDVEARIAASETGLHGAAPEPFTATETEEDPASRVALAEPEPDSASESTATVSQGPEAMADGSEQDPGSPVAETALPARTDAEDGPDAAEPEAGATQGETEATEDAMDAENDAATIVGTVNTADAAADSGSDAGIVVETDASTGHEDESTPLARELTEITRRRRALASQKLPLPESTRVFTVANQKGGVGKTTSAVNLAAALARTGARVLVIDLDPQGNASTALGVEHRSETTSVYDVMINDEAMANVVQKSPEFDSLYCVPATIHLAGAEIELVSLVAREQRLRTALRTFLNASPDPFHYVFIDCPPSLGLLTINAFVAAREVLIPIQCEYYALEGLSQLLTNIQLIERHLNSDLTVSTILLTMYDARTNLANQVAQEVRDHFPDQVLSTLIPRSVRISEAPSYGQSVISYDSNSSGSLSYLEAAAEIARRGVPN